MLAQVTYIQMFIMADSQDEFMPICDVSALKTTQNIYRAGVGLGRRSISNIFDTSGRRSAGIGSTHDARRPADATIFGTQITDARPMTHDVPR